MNKATALLASVLTALAVGVITAGSASAGTWMLGEDLEEAGGEQTLLAGGTFTLTAGTKTVTCSSLAGAGTVGTEGTGLATEIKLTNCTTGQSGCLPLTAGQTKGTVLWTNVPTLLTERENSGKEKVLADELKENPTSKEVGTLKFEAESGKSCSEYPETKVRGQDAAEVKNATESLLFPSVELKGNTFEAFGKAAKLTALIEQKPKEKVDGKLQGQQAIPAQFITFFPLILQFSATLNEELFYTLKDRGTREVELVEQKLAGADPAKFEITDLNMCFKKKLKTGETCKVTVKLKNVMAGAAIYEGKVTYVGGLANVPIIPKGLVNS